MNGEPSAVARRRRRDILDSAIVAIARHGLSATTVERVAELAKISPGTIVFHFPKKTELLLATLDDVAAEFEAARKRVLDETVGRPADALRRLVHINLDPGVSAPDKVAVWYAFWGEANARKVYSQRVGAYDDAWQADLVALFKDLIAGSGTRGLDAEAVAFAFAGLLEGLWQDILVKGRRFDRKAARNLALAYLASLFPDHFDMPHRKESS
ncbi:MAG TPA: TetR family transcriptional regulator C-terminal domain-containing protein [Aestuariivirgaceae bacterium]|nr:TetR family transcriptional regulator C-terminal domain-containing protein [Aestuariivirgaceae bacterium]